MLGRGGVHVRLRSAGHVGGVYVPSVAAITTPVRFANVVERARGIPNDFW